MEMTNTLKEFNRTLIEVINLEQCKLPSNSKEYQDNIKNHIKVLEQTTLLINQLELFSTNESLEDLQTSYLKFLLIPAFLGYLKVKLIGSDSREELIKLSKIYYVDFLNRLNSYKITNIDAKQLVDRSEEEFFPKSQPSLEEMARERNEKIKMYNQSRELDEKLIKLQYILDDEDGNKVDDEVVRDFFLSLIKRWVNRVVDEIKSLSMEEVMLKNRPKLSNDKAKSYKSAANFKPFIITKNEMQKKVFGLGYPSRPILTIEEFVNQKIEEGSLSVTTEDYRNSLQKWAEDPDEKNREDEKDDEEKEKLIDKDDEFALQKARAWDDWKDEHKRGEGNRMNMG